jgi:LemA protein
MTALWTALALLVLLALWLALAFNALVRARALVREGWSGIDVQLHRRHDLIPNLVETVRAYAAHEAEALARVTALRGAMGASEGTAPGAAVAEAARREGELTRALGRLFAVVEAYPQLKADANYRQLAEQLAAVEDELQMARRYYNGAVRRLNVNVQSFPSNIAARLFGFAEAEFFEIGDEAVRAAPRVRLD